MLIIITINISNMANNLDTIIDFMNTLQQLQMNNTNIDGINQDLHTIKDCVLNRYCKRT